MFSFNVLQEQNRENRLDWQSFSKVYLGPSYICDETFGENNQQLIKSFHGNIGVGHTILNVFVTLLSKE